MMHCLRWWSPLLLLLLLLTCNAAIKVDKDDDTSKYMYTDKSPPVREYKGETENNFATSTAPRIVEFYSPYCGGCRNFKARYVELAQEVTKLHPEVEFYAVSCTAFKSVCNEHQVRAYPSLFAFSANQKNSTYLKRNSKEKGGHGVSSLLEGMGLAINAEEKQDAIIKAEEKRQLVDEDDDDEVDENDESDAKKIKTKNDREAWENDEASNGGAVEADTPDEEEEVDETGNDEEETQDDPEEEEADEPEEDSDEPLEEEKDGSEAEPDDAVTKADDDTDEEDESPEEPDTKEYVESGKDDDDDDAEDSATQEENGGFEDDETEEVDDDDFAGVDPQAPVYGGKKPPAGAKYGRDAPKDMDKWKTIMAERRKELAERRANKKLLAKKEAKKKEKLYPLAVSNTLEGSTKTMLANTPGTPEFEKRKREILERLQKATRGKFRGNKDPYGKQEFKKGNLPIVKQLKKQSALLKGMQKMPVVKRLVKVTPEEELYWDASHSFVTALRYSVFTSNEPLSAKKKSALKSWLELISVSLPPEWALHELVDELHSSMDYISESDVNLKRLLNKHPLPRDGWSPSCSKGRQGQGYSCGMWKLMHIISLGVAEHRGGNNLVEAGVVDPGTRVFSPDEAAETFREYMAYFFGCVECRNSFISKYDDCSFRRCVRLTNDRDSSDPADWKQLAMWLWEVHNDVSVRIADKNGSDQVKALWPSLALCLVCFEEDGSFDEDSVFELLEKTYWSGSLDPKTDRLLSFKNVDSGGGGLSFVWVMMGIAIALVVFMRRQIKSQSPFNVNLLASSSAMLRRSGMGGAKVRKV